MAPKVKESDLEDRTLICKDCGKKFIWTAGEQKFFIDKDLKNIPKRCKICTAEYKNKLREKHPAWWVKCSRCGKKAEVCFEPKTEHIFCENCFNKEIEKRNDAIKALGEEIPA